MTVSEATLEIRTTADRLDLVAAGSWTAANAERLETLVDGAERHKGGARRVDIAGIQDLDTFGAWLVQRLVRSSGTAATELVGVRDRYRNLLDRVGETNRRPAPAAPPPRTLAGWVADVGRGVTGLWHEFAALLAMFGALAVAVVRAVLQPSRFRLTSFVHHLDRVGLQAVPIIVLVTFLIGGIIAQQGFFHFRKFGADDYVVDMVGILVLREIGVLIVAIMVAGRSGSSYTAELGSMKMREEIDALTTMGRDPVEVLILPRVAALVVALPILAFIGSMSALYGGGLVAWAYGGMDQLIYIARLREAVSLTHFEVGMIKAPFMALVVGAVACSEGMRVKGSAESLGLQTTVSVVKSIFLVIVLDGFFAIFFAAIGM
jgi:phospholipid/cholesterol/gamma-HCH transport system permease protein